MLYSKPASDYKVLLVHISRPVHPADQSTFTKFRLEFIYGFMWSVVISKIHIYFIN